MFKHSVKRARPMNFVAIDFETANPKHNSAYAIGITPVKNGIAGDTP